MLQKIYKWTDKIRSKVAEFSKKLGEKGQGMTEYALILAAIAVIAVVAVYNSDSGLKAQITTSFTNATNDIKDANEKNHPTANP